MGARRLPCPAMSSTIIPPPLTMASKTLTPRSKTIRPTSSGSVSWSTTCFGIDAPEYLKDQGPSRIDHVIDLNGLEGDGPRHLGGAVHVGLLPGGLKETDRQPVLGVSVCRRILGPDHHRSVIILGVGIGARRR